MYDDHDDDEESFSPLPSSSDRAWRHPSESSPAQPSRRSPFGRAEVVAAAAVGAGVATVAVSVAHVTPRPDLALIVAFVGGVQLAAGFGTRRRRGLGIPHRAAHVAALAALAALLVVGDAGGPHVATLEVLAVVLTGAALTVAVGVAPTAVVDARSTTSGSSPSFAWVLAAAAVVFVPVLAAGH